MNEREAYISLNLMEKIGPVKVRALIEHFGSITSIFTESAKELAQVQGIGPKLSEHIVATRDSIPLAKELKAAANIGAEIITPLDESYPFALKQIHDPPLALYVRGELKPEDKNALAIVGSRRTSNYGIMTADRLAFQLAKAGITVVSGLARGIDAAAHEGALKSGNRTIAVIGSGLDRLYPTENKELAERIVEQGALISEFPLGTEPNRSTFPMRNRIVSGLSLGVLVVEAARNSGAMITVDEAMEQGRQIFAIPSRLDYPGSAGPHYLIKQGAKLVEDVSDILEEFEYLKSTDQSAAEDSQLSFDAIALSTDEQRILEVLSTSEISVDELARNTAIPMSQLSGLLIGLEIKRLVRMLPGRYIELANKF